MSNGTAYTTMVILLSAVVQCSLLEVTRLSRLCKRITSTSGDFCMTDSNWCATG